MNRAAALRGFHIMAAEVPIGNCDKRD